jgi:CHAT domain-containing protein
LTHYQLSKKETSLKFKEIYDRRNLLKYLYENESTIYNDLYNWKDLEVKEILEQSQKDSVAILLYYMGSTYYNKSVLFVISIYNGKIELKEINDLKKVLYLVSKYNFLVSRDIVPNNWDKFVSVNKDLYSILFQYYFENLSKVKSITIIPDNILSKVSFESFIIHNNCESAPIYVIDSVPIQYKYTIKRNNKNTLYKSREYLGFSWSDKNTIIQSKFTSLPELPNSFIEILQSLKYFQKNGLIFLGNKSSKTNFLNNSTKAKVLHLSLHGKAGDNRLNSMLFFRRANSIDTLFNYEILYKNINPELLILSACQSSTGYIQEEEGVFSIAQAFYSLGASNIIANNWNLSDTYSSKIIVNYLNKVSSGHSHCYSLFLSKKELLEKEPELRFKPWLWGGINLFN